MLCSKEPRIQSESMLLCFVDYVKAFDRLEEFKYWESLLSANEYSEKDIHATIGMDKQVSIRYKQF